MQLVLHEARGDYADVYEVSLNGQDHLAYVIKPSSGQLAQIDSLKQKARDWMLANYRHYGLLDEAKAQKMVDQFMSGKESLSMHSPFTLMIYTDRSGEIEMMTRFVADDGGTLPTGSILELRLAGRGMGKNLMRPKPQIVVEDMPSRKVLTGTRLLEADGIRYKKEVVYKWGYIEIKNRVRDPAADHALAPLSYIFAEMEGATVRSNRAIPLESFSAADQLKVRTLRKENGLPEDGQLRWHPRDI